VTGEDSQNAIIGANGTPDARSPVMSGRMVTPQTGVIVPTTEAITIIVVGRPSNRFAVTFPAPLAATQADSRSPPPINGATAMKLSTTNQRIAPVFPGHIVPVIATVAAPPTKIETFLLAKETLAIDMAFSGHTDKLLAFMSEMNSINMSYEF
jgi:hypothetical protein